MSRKQVAAIAARPPFAISSFAAAIPELNPVATTAKIPKKTAKALIIFSIYPPPVFNPYQNHTK